MGTLAGREFSVRLVDRMHYALTGVNPTVKSPPLRRVLCRDVDVLKGNGEVDEIEIEVLKTPKAELVLGELLGLQRVLSQG